MRRMQGGGLDPYLRHMERFQRGGGQYYSGPPFQYGRGLMVYSGVPFQHGNGLGDILRGIGRFIWPIISPVASRAVSSFISGTASGLSSGKNIKDSAIGAIEPTLGSTFDEVGNQVKRKMTGGGVYKRRKRSKSVKRSKATKRKVVHKHKKAKRSLIHENF
jgi:hypothetical protein